MPTRESAPIGTPCWIDLWTSDTESSRAFYSELLGWEAQEPSPEFGGYFMFTRDGVPIAGAMGDMGDMRANDTWKMYLAVENAAKSLEVAQAEGAEVLSPAMPVADLGIQAVLNDPTGAAFGLWEPGTFPGITVVNEVGAPNWYELHTRDYARAVSFYKTVFGLETDVVGDSDEFRYTTLRDPSAQGEVAGIMDSSSFLPEGVPPHWAIYFKVADPDAAVAKLLSLGGSVVMEPADTPYGRLATVADPAGAQFRLIRNPDS